MVKTTVAPTRTQKPPVGSRGFGSFAALVFGNPAARMIEIVRQHQDRPAAPGTSPIELLGQLAALHAAGLLTPAEFAAKKADLLARI